MHNIQYHILESLTAYKVRRFSELRPAHAESNLFQYHLGKLIKDGYISKRAGGYTLSGKGLYYADRQSSALKQERIQAKIITIIAITNSQNEVFMYKKPRQPYIGGYIMPAGKIHEGELVGEAAQREVREKIGGIEVSLKHYATSHMTIRESGVIVSEYFAFLHTGRFDGQMPVEGIWHNPATDLNYVPGVAELLVIDREVPSGLQEWNIKTDS